MVICFTYQQQKKQGPVVNCYNKWEEAFRIYAAIYSKANPHRAIEIMQYLDDIKGAAKDNTWESVYEYDLTFRDIMSVFPNCNWGIIHSTLWTKTMKPKPSQASSLVGDQNVGSVCKHNKKNHLETVLEVQSWAM